MKTIKDASKEADKEEMQVSEAIPAYEILSPSNPNHDRALKFNKYRETGVRESYVAS